MMERFRACRRAEIGRRNQAKQLLDLQTTETENGIRKVKSPWLRSVLGSQETRKHKDAASYVSPDQKEVRELQTNSGSGKGGKTKPWEGMLKGGGI